MKEKRILYVVLTAAPSIDAWDNSKEGRVFKFIDNNFDNVFRKYFSLRESGTIQLFIFFFKLIFTLFFEKYDLVYFNNSISGSFFIIPKLLKKKVIVEAEDIYWTYLIFKKNGGLIDKIEYYIKIFFSKNCHHCDLIIVTHDFIKDTINQLNNKKCRIKVIRHIVNPAFFDVNHEKPEKYQNKLIIGYWGDLTPIKMVGLKKVIDAIDKIKNKEKIVFMVIGGPTEELINANNNKINLICPGYVYPPQLSRCLNYMDIFIFPLDGLGTKVSEALAAGLPVIVPYGIAEELKEWGEIYFVEESVNSYKNVIEKLITKKTDFKKNKDIFKRKYGDPPKEYVKAFKDAL